MMFRFILALVVAFAFSTMGFAVYYWAVYAAGDNIFKEYVVVYHQVKTVKDTTVDGKTVEQRYYETQASPPTTRWRLILPVVFINNLVILVALALLSLRYSHKFAGPAYRIKATITKSIAGEPDLRIHLREKDELKDLAEQVNKLLEALDRARS